MNVLSLFSGIGGLDLGLERAGMTIVGQVEIDPWCRKILAKHWPEVPRHDNVRTCADWWGGRDAPDLVCGGFPCQPVSSAGRRLAQDDPRWLWPAMAEVIRRLQPRYALMENVPGLLARGMGDVLGDLAACGYDAEWDCVPASAVGAPHRRDRVWIVGYANGIRTRQDAGGSGAAAYLRPVNGPQRRGDSRPDIAGDSPHVADARHGTDAERSRQTRWQAGQRLSERDVSRSGREVMADANGTAWPSERPAGQAVFRPGAIERPGRCGGSYRDHWAVEPDVGRSLDGLPHWLDRTGLLNESLMAYWAYATASETCPGQVLRMVRDTAPEEEVQRAAGGLRGVSAQEVLRSFLRELADHDHTGRIPLACAEAARAEMRSVRGDPQTPCPPCERGHRRHDPREHSDALRELSQLLARRAGEAWAAYQRSDAGPVLNAWQDGWETGIPRVAHGIPARVDRLRGLGNAVVPQVAEHIGRLILEAAL